MIRSWRRGFVVLGAALALLATQAPALGSGSSGASGSRAAAGGEGLQLVRVRHSLLGTHFWYQQTYSGLPVLGGYLARHVDRVGRLAGIDDGRLAVSGEVPAVVGVSALSAKAAAGAHDGGDPRSATLSVLPGAHARLVWRVLATKSNGSTETFVDAMSGGVLTSRRLARDAFGSGRVFKPNPVVTLGNESLRDRNDSNYAGLSRAYRSVVLTNLDDSGYLRGNFARVLSLQQRAAYSPTHRYSYPRSDNRFEQLMSYYDVTETQKYIQSLGFQDVNNESQVLLPDNYRGDNSFYDPSDDTITLGTGGVDDAEDAEVTWHEYGHAIQDDQVPNYGQGEEAGAIGEGFGDYWAVTMSQPVSPRRNLPCVADWDSVSYTSGPVHCLRRVDRHLTVADKVGEVHFDGQIWSRALWDISRALGRSRADRLILESQFRFAPRSSFASAAKATIATARMLYGEQAAAVCRRAFTARGIH